MTFWRSAARDPCASSGWKSSRWKRGDVFLEVGFGTGHVLVAAAHAVGPTGRVYGVDLSLGMARQAQRVIRATGVTERIHLICGDGERLPLRSDSVSRVFMSFTLELFDTPAIPKVLAEYQRVLHLRGRVVVVGLSKEMPSGLTLAAFEWTHRHFPNLLDCRPIYMRRAVDAAGGFRIWQALVEQMWVPVEIVVADKLEAP